MKLVVNYSFNTSSKIYIIFWSHNQWTSLSIQYTRNFTAIMSIPKRDHNLRATIHLSWYIVYFLFLFLLCSHSFLINYDLSLNSSFMIHCVLLISTALFIIFSLVLFSTASMVVHFAFLFKASINVMSWTILSIERRIIF